MQKGSQTYMCSYYSAHIPAKSAYRHDSLFTPLLRLFETFCTFKTYSTNGSPK